MPHSAANEIRLVSHSNVFYWWPAWVIGYAAALFTFIQGQPISTEAAAVVGYVHPSNNPGLTFIAALMLLIIFTNAKLRGIYSILTIVTAAFFAVLFAWLGWWDRILEFVPNLSARANLGFYLVFSTIMLGVWVLGFFFFDRLVFWRIRPGQLLEERLIGGSSHSYDTNGLVFEKREQDWFRHVLLGIGAGDLQLRTSDVRKEIIEIPNVLFVDSKVRKIERLIAIKPEHAPSPASEQQRAA
jgi:hypothetical protein